MAAVFIYLLFIFTSANKSLFFSYLTKKEPLMKLWVFQHLKRPQRKCLKEILIRWREWASTGSALPSRCALLDRLLKPLNLFQRKSSTKIDGNNQYVPAALLPSSKVFIAIFFISPSHNLLFWLQTCTFYIASFFFTFLSPSPSLPPPLPRRSRPVCPTLWTSCPWSCWQPSGLCVLETAWRCWASGYRGGFPRWDVGLFLFSQRLVYILTPNAQHR